MAHAGDHQPSVRVVLESTGPVFFPQNIDVSPEYEAETREILRQLARAMGVQLAREHHAARLAASAQSPQTEKP